MAIGVGLAIVAAIRRRFRVNGPDSGAGLTLDQARRIRAQGMVTEEEYNQIKHAIIRQPAQGERSDAVRRA